MIGTYAENVSRELDKLDGVLENLLVRQNQTNTKLGLLAKILEMIINNTEKGNIASLKINEMNEPQIVYEVLYHDFKFNLQINCHPQR